MINFIMVCIVVGSIIFISVKVTQWLAGGSGNDKEDFYEI